MADGDRWTLLGKLKMAVRKITFLLHFNVLKLASIIGTPSGTRRLSFNNRPGLRACVDESEELGSSRRLQRTTSYPSSEDIDDDDIDKRADAFIANFYKQLRYERQISLQLSYYRPGNASFDSSTSP